MRERTEIISVSIGSRTLARLDAWIAAAGLPSRSGGLQQIVREKLATLAGIAAEGPAVAAVSLIYDHHRRELMERLTHLQHERMGLIVASTHVHLDHSRCFEVLILRGPAREVAALGEALIAVRGIDRGEVRITPMADVVGDEHGDEGPHWHSAAHAHPPAAMRAKSDRKRRSSGRRGR